MSELIRVEDDTYATLESLRGDDETFDERVARLLRQRRAVVRAGAGFWAGSDAAARAREERASLK